MNVRWRSAVTGNHIAVLPPLKLSYRAGVSRYPEAFCAYKASPAERADRVWSISRARMTPLMCSSRGTYGKVLQFSPGVVCLSVSYSVVKLWSSEFACPCEAEANACVEVRFAT